MAFLSRLLVASVDVRFADLPQIEGATGRFLIQQMVSTDRQGRSGLGLDAQRAAVGNYLNGGNWSIVAEFTEIAAACLLRFSGVG